MVELNCVNKDSEKPEECLPAWVDQEGNLRIFPRNTRHAGVGITKRTGKSFAADSPRLDYATMYGHTPVRIKKIEYEVID